MIKKKIMVNTSFRGTHNWPEASRFAGEEVKFLEAEHRHTFHVKAELGVNDSDREVEFFVFQKMVDEGINSLYNSDGGLAFRLGRRSCEHMCEEIITYLREKEHLTNAISVEVWEDNEVGARVDSTVE